VGRGDCRFFWILVVPQCVPKHVPNTTSFYPISFALRFLLGTYVTYPKRKTYNISILGQEFRDFGVKKIQKKEP
jgi:hypothetical protein